MTLFKTVVRRKLFWFILSLLILDLYGLLKLAPEVMTTGGDLSSGSVVRVYSMYKHRPFYELRMAVENGAVCSELELALHRNGEIVAQVYAEPHPRSPVDLVFRETSGHELEHDGLGLVTVRGIALAKGYSVYELHAEPAECVRKAILRSGGGPASYVFRRLLAFALILLVAFLTLLAFCYVSSRDRGQPI